MKVFKIEIYDSFLNLRMSGEFEGETQVEAEQQAREVYAFELGTDPEEIEIVGIEEIEGEQINAEKLKAYIENDMITEFDSAEECLEYFNTYDFQNFQSVEELKRYQDKYGFGYGGKWYHISYDEALDVYEKR